MRCFRLQKAVLFFCALTSVLLCSSCGRPLDGTQDSDISVQTAVQPSQLVTRIDLTGYRLIRSEAADEDLIEIASALYREISERSPTSGIEIGDDWVREPLDADTDTSEILLGLTNRPSSSEAQAALPGYLDFSVTVDTKKNKISIFANTTERLAEAAEWFVNSLTVEEEKLYYTDDGNYIDRYVYPIDSATLCGEPLEKYTIVVPTGELRERNAADQLALALAEQTGCLLEVIEDSTARKEKEILVGVTTRGGAADVGNQEYRIEVSGGQLFLTARSTSGYTAIKERVLELIKEEKLTEGFAEQEQYQETGLDSARVMFIGNSFTYYGDCTEKDKADSDQDNGYFKQAAAAAGDNVTVTCFTYGGAYLSDGVMDLEKTNGLYERLVLLHPNYYGNGSETDHIYMQDYVILQQAGSNASNTLAAAKKIMSLFPPETKFCFYVTTHDIKKNLTYTLNTAKMLHSKEDVIYIPLGQLVVDLWKGNVAVPNAAEAYTESSFIVKQRSSSGSTDGWHPNYLTGYITALMTYHAITGRSIVGIEPSFVSRDMQYYTLGPSNFDQILSSPNDMEGIQRLIEEYVRRYN